ncbi:MAG: mercury resistance system periplasmic binding protein MerP [Burkholderiales bacterium]
MRILILPIALSMLMTLAATVFAAPDTVTLSVPGMNCPVCPITVKKALTRVDGVSRVAVDYGSKEATVTFDDAKASVDALTEATANAGYPSSVKVQ